MIFVNSQAALRAIDSVWRKSPFNGSLGQIEHTCMLDNETAGTFARLNSLSEDDYMWQSINRMAFDIIISAAR